MYQFLFWRNDIRYCCLQHEIHHWRIDGAFRNCMVDGVGRSYWKLHIQIRKKSLQTCKPDPVYAIIYLSRQLLAGINLPTLYLGRAAFKRYYTWHFSMQGLPANDVTIKSCELLPHIFILTVFVKTQTLAVIFCGTICSRQRRDPAIHRCIALYCPDFPTSA